MTMGEETVLLLCVLHHKFKTPFEDLLLILDLNLVEGVSIAAPVRSHEAQIPPWVAQKTNDA